MNFPNSRTHRLSYSTNTVQQSASVASNSIRCIYCGKFMQKFGIWMGNHPHH